MVILQNSCIVSSMSMDEVFDITVVLEVVFFQ